jgi:hypothetical protein
MVLSRRRVSILVTKYNLTMFATIFLVSTLAQATIKRYRDDGVPVQ